MNRIKQYAIASERSIEDLCKSTAKLIGEGYLPTGGIATYTEDSGTSAGKTKKTVFCQALILPFRPEDAVGQVIAHINGR